jgi:hypothetical protein
MRLCHLGLFRNHFVTPRDQWPFTYRHHHSILLLRLATVISLFFIWLDLTHLSSLIEFTVQLDTSLCSHRVHSLQSKIHS